MSLLDAAMIAQMKRTQESSMMHTCSIEPYIVAEDGTISYGTAETSICGFKTNTGSSGYGSLYETVQMDAQMRLPLDVRIAVKDRVKILSSFGAELDPAPVFEVCRIPDSFGPSGKVVELTEIYL